MLDFSIQGIGWAYDEIRGSREVVEMSVVDDGVAKCCQISKHFCMAQLWHEAFTSYSLNETSTRVGSVCII